jgi:hypothetical protein
VHKPERASRDRRSGNGRAACRTHHHRHERDASTSDALSLSLCLWLGSGFEHATLGSRRLNPSQWTGSWILKNSLFRWISLAFLYIYTCIHISLFTFIN